MKNAHPQNAKVSAKSTTSILKSRINCYKPVKCTCNCSRCENKKITVIIQRVDYTLQNKIAMAYAKAKESSCLDLEVTKARWEDYNYLKNQRDATHSDQDQILEGDSHGTLS